MNHTIRVACVTTSINVPTVLSLMRAYGPDVGFFVAGDMKTPQQCEELVKTLGPNSFYLSVDHQKSLGYSCSELIPWNCIQRRNIATLEALKWKADVIVLTDDDNLPMNEFYFADHVNALTKPHSGIGVVGIDDWFDVGQLLNPASPHRGFPHDKYTGWRADPCVAKVGVNAGICMGNPDISACFRIANNPTVHQTSKLLDGGVVVGSGTWTVFNSQNTAFIRELAPAMFMMPGVGRFDDIYASLICQRVMRERELHVRFGHPLVWQERNQHDLIKDLRAEIDGMENIVKFAQSLDDLLALDRMSVIEAVSTIYASDDILPTKAVQAAHAWLEDCKAVMG